MFGLLQQSPALTTLDLSGCQLSGTMATHLCAVLQLPGCRLQSLRWGQRRERCGNTASPPWLGVGARGFPQTSQRSPAQGPPEGPC